MKPMTSTILVQYSTNWAIKPSGSWDPFLEGPVKFSRPESRSKIWNLMITELLRARKASFRGFRETGSWSFCEFVIYP